MRVVSLVPAATEIMGALGLMDQVVGVSHDCDFPPEATTKPRVTHCEIHGTLLPSKNIDSWVNETISTTGTLYTLDKDLLRRLSPDVILTQRLCNVCAVEYGSVAAFAETLTNPPEIVNLEPMCLDDIFENIYRVAKTLRVPERGDELLTSLKKRQKTVEERVAEISYHPICYLMEWIDPPFCSGHWGPELVEIAGGIEPLGRKGDDSIRIQWESVLKAQPEIIVIACCGYTVERTLEDIPLLQKNPGWDELPAVKNKKVFAVDGSAYFSRPGPRIIDSLEILAEIFHPNLFAGRFPSRGIITVDQYNTGPNDPLPPGRPIFDKNGALSREFLLQRGICCQSGCRNCPYGFNRAEHNKG